MQPRSDPRSVLLRHRRLASAKYEHTAKTVEHNASADEGSAAIDTVGVYYFPVGMPCEYGCFSPAPAPYLKEVFCAYLWTRNYFTVLSCA